MTLDLFGLSIECGEIRSTYHSHMQVSKDERNAALFATSNQIISLSDLLYKAEQQREQEAEQASDSE